MDTIIGRTFKNAKVNLDFSAYEKCTFIDCEIITNYGIFSLVNNDFKGCKLTLGNPAINIAVLVELMTGIKIPRR